MMIAGLNGFKRSGVSLTVIQPRQSHTNTRNPNLDLLVFCCLIGRSSIHANGEMFRMTQCFTLVYRENDLHIRSRNGGMMLLFFSETCCRFFVFFFWRKHIIIGQIAFCFKWPGGWCVGGVMLECSDMAQSSGRFLGGSFCDRDLVGIGIFFRGLSTFATGGRLP